MTKTMDLIRCPRCNGNAEIVSENKPYFSSYGRCTRCGNATDSDDSYYGAVQEWNNQRKVTATPQTIRAIETKYKGYRFRSRLEARWAVFFDTLYGDGRWEYEKEGFDLGALGWYLPDFYIHHGLWVEIKPQFTPDKIKLKTIDQCSMLAFKLKQYVILVEGNPWPNEYNVCFFEKDSSFPTLLGSNYCFSKDGFLAEKHIARIDDELMHAFDVARSARFEHGESPK